MKTETMKSTERQDMVVLLLMKQRYLIPAWGAVTTEKGESKITGFGADESFDAFLSMNEPPPVPQGTPARFSRQESAESDKEPDFSIFIK
jgi:hypothetical protein